MAEKYWSIIATISAIVSAFISWRFWRLSESNFLLTHRPFVWAENRGRIDMYNILRPVPNTVAIRVLNAPAYIISEEFVRFIMKDKEKEYIERQNSKNFIRYPDDKNQYTYNFAMIADSLIDKLEEGQELRRFIKIQYKWLSFKKEYFFESEWRYDKKDKKWDIVYQKAN